MSPVWPKHDPSLLLAFGEVKRVWAHFLFGGYLFFGGLERKPPKTKTFSSSKSAFKTDPYCGCIKIHFAPDGMHEALL